MLLLSHKSRGSGLFFLARRLGVRAQHAGAEDDDSTGHPGRRRRLAFLVAYDGTHLSGSQLVSGGPVETTVDGFIIKALEKLELIRPYAFGQPGQLMWDRAARTGPGEHAAGNILTMMVRLKSESTDKTMHMPLLRRQLNELLPAAVRVLSVARVGDRFSAVDNVSSRAFHYWLPLDSLLTGGERKADPESDVVRNALGRFRSSLNEFVGPHSFHNFGHPEARASFVQPAASSVELRRAWKRAHGVADAASLHDVLMALDDRAQGKAVLSAFRSSSSGGPASGSPFGVFLESLMRGPALLGSPQSEALPDLSPRLGSASEWVLSPQVTRTILHAEVSDPIPVTAVRTGAGTLRQLRLGLPSEDPLDHRFEYPGVPIGGLWEVPPRVASLAPPKLPSGAGIRAADGDSAPDRVVVGHAVRVLLHANGLMDSQAATMIGTALAVQKGLLDVRVLRAALVLPACPPLPQAPPGGLVMVEAHPTEASFVTWRHPKGTPDDAMPHTTTPQRFAHLDDPRHADIAAAAAQSPDIAILRADAAAARRHFFDTILAPRLISFCGFNAAPGSESSPFPQGAYSATAGAALAAHPPSAAAALTIAAWAERVLPAMSMDRSLQAAVLDAFAAAEASLATPKREAEAAQLRASADAAAKLWAKEDRAPPKLSAPLVDGQRASRAADLPGRRAAAIAAATPGLSWASLDEVRRSILPPGLTRALCARCRLPRQRDAHDIARAIAFRVMREEWPSVATAEQHAEWVAGIGVLLLLREGQLAVLLERIQSRQAVLAKVRRRKQGGPL